MRKIRTTTFIVTIALMAGMLTSCGKSVFEVTENTGKAVTITAEKAEKDASVMFGSIEVEEGEQLSISADLAKGSVRVEILPEAEEQAIDKIPEMDEEAIMVGNFVRTDAESGTVPVGSYLVKATCLERATGTVRIVTDKLH